MDNLPTETTRRRAIAWATALAASTSLILQPHEAELLEHCAHGGLALKQVLARLEIWVHHVLCLRPFFKSQLLNLLKQSRTRNEQRNLMGLLCHSHDGHLMQVLEDKALAVHEAFARILRDGHHQ